MSVYTYEIVVPGAVVPAIIGKNGIHIQRLQDIFCVKLIFIGENSGIYNKRILRIQGLSKNIEYAQKKIEDMITGFSTNEENIFDLSKEDDAFVESNFFVPVLVAEDVIGNNKQNLKDIKASLNLISLETQGTCCNEEGECIVLNIQGSVEKVSQAIQLLQRSTEAFMSAKKQYDANIIIENDSVNEKPFDQCLDATSNFNPSLTNQTLKYKVEDDTISKIDVNGVNSPDLSRFALRLTEINTANFKRICEENYNAALTAAMEVFVNSDSKEKIHYEFLRTDLLSEIKKLQNAIQLKDNKIDGILAEVDQLQKEKENFASKLGKLKITIEAMNNSNASNLICKMCSRKVVIT